MSRISVRAGMHDPEKEANPNLFCVSWRNFRLLSVFNKYYLLISFYRFWLPVLKPKH